MNLQMIYPMFAMVILTVAVLVKTVLVRFKAVREGQVSVRYFKTFSEGGNPPERMLQAQRHFSNLFEMPVLFYAGCLAAMVTPVLTADVQIWAWLFVAARVAHAWIHMGVNSIRPRMLAFGVGVVAVCGLWVTVVLRVALSSF